MKGTMDPGLRTVRLILQQNPDLAPKPTEAVSNESLGDLLAHIEQIGYKTKIGNHKDNAL